MGETVYTHEIINDNVTNAKEFLNICIRNFNCLNFMSGSLNKNLDYTEEIKTYYENVLSRLNDEYNNAKEKYESFKKKSDEELYKDYVERVNAEMDRYIKNIIPNQTEEKVKCSKILEEIRNWDCSQDFEIVKNFAINQLLETIESNVSIYPKPESVSYDGFKKYKEEQEFCLKDNMDYFSKMIDSSTQKYKDSLDYYERFKEELKKIKEI